MGWGLESIGLSISMDVNILELYLCLGGWTFGGGTYPGLPPPRPTMTHLPQCFSSHCCCRCPIMLDSCQCGSVSVHIAAAAALSCWTPVSVAVFQFTLLLPLPYHVGLLSVWQCFSSHCCCRCPIMLDSCQCGSVSVHIAAAAALSCWTPVSVAVFQCHVTPSLHLLYGIMLYSSSVRTCG